MFRYETVLIHVDVNKLEVVAQAIVDEAKKRPQAALIHQTPIAATSTWSYGGRTKAIILTFEFVDQDQN